MNYNELSEIPYFGETTSNITLLSLVHNTIPEINAEQLQVYLSLENLDLSSNLISEIKASSFPRMQLKYLNLSNNRITTLEAGCLDNLSSSLMVIKLNRNRISTIPPKIFRLPHVQFLELKRNRIKIVESLTFQGLESLKSLKMQRNGISRLMDGAFFGLGNIEELELEHNNLTEVNKGWLYGLRTLQQLYVSQNAITRISPDAWEFCQRLAELDLSYNQLTRLKESAFVGLGFLEKLNLGDNHINHIADGVFRGLTNLQTLDLRNNEISWAIEDANEAFMGLSRLNKLILQGNQIKTITKKAFSGLEGLEYLDLSNNAIMSIQENAFAQAQLKELVLNTSSLLCDCQLKWLPQWLSESHLLQAVSVSCAHPEWLAGQSLLSVDPDDFVCELPSFLKTPMDLTIRTGAMARLECAAEGHPPPQISWQKDGGTDFPAARERRMHVMPEDDVFFIANVKMEDMGIYSCMAQNIAGGLSANATLTVLALVRHIWSAVSSSGLLRTRGMQSSWSKSSRSYRDDEVTGASFLQGNETPSFMRPLEDRTVTRGETAVLQCIAGGSPAPRLNWTKDDGPLTVTERHFFAAANQLLIIVDAGLEDAGKYTCIMSNTLGTERGHIYLNVLASPNCDSSQSAIVNEEDGWTTVGIVIIVVVCCVVGTSLVWVIVIYHMRRKNEDYSITNTEEMNLPADIPSYLSSQGTLSEPQEGYSNLETGSHQQLMPPAGSYMHKGTDGGTAPLVICSDCYDNANIYSRTREYCPYAFITEEDPLDQALPNLMVQMPKETYTVCTQNETSALGSLLADRDVPVFCTNRDKKCDKKIYSQQIIEPFQVPLWGGSKDLACSHPQFLHHPLAHEPPQPLRSDGIANSDQDQASPRPCHKLREENFDFSRTQNIHDHSETT
ncbi:leucine-rich repeats and immunoglobulin-like domains protein 2 isoform X1 [Cyanistes caeruleus]|uniref:leucine-rich repeats and immunoglobulin-like domains protein 2 isoform X1 n=1 Tax=Cyanistes caeruleus TaxID=156563 RepID=UPI000CDAA49D|nr:leucine-rich repeats and immunoglobulin-like domains protein 2 isoform X1 [Cyanistes caeruleus]